MIILKRWYCALLKLAGQTLPIYLATDGVRSAMDTLNTAARLGDPNIANYKGVALRFKN